MRQYMFIISMLLFFLTGCGNSPAVPMSKEDLYGITKGKTFEVKYVKAWNGYIYQCRRATPEEIVIGKEVLLTGTSGPYKISTFYGNYFAAKNANNIDTIFFYNSLNACNDTNGGSSSVDVYIR